MKLMFWGLIFYVTAFANTRNVYFGKTLNNGLAIAEIEVLSEEDLHSVVWDSKKIYVLPKTPPEIKPIAGIITVDSGSMISHVQLLCRSLGIPNGSISRSEYEILKKIDGKKVIYAAYDGKEVLLKEINKITEKEKILIEEYKNEMKVSPIKLAPVNLNRKELIALRDLGREDSGKVSGPKAANLGFLKRLFPNRVSEGFVIPFGRVAEVFKNNKIDKEILKLNSIKNDLEVKKQLKLIRDKIQRIKIPKDLLKEVLTKSAELLKENTPAGLFLRSDTNVEDLPQFSGAGLNKTVPNIIDLKKVPDAIKLVWSSPWRERSHSWRSKYITNPETILPSILIMKSVDAKKAGVMATMNFDSGSFEDLFVSANEGLGFKVVDGEETPEQWLIFKKESEEETLEDRLELINQAYATTQYVLNNSKGGVEEIPTSLIDILTNSELSQLESIVNKLKKQTTFPIPFESEFGINKAGNVQLFQIRPLVLRGTALGKKIIRSIYNENKGD